MSEFNPHKTDPTMNALIEKMPNIRVFYSKTGPAKYISHLDITRCMQRSLKRAGVPVWYTQGFNPHMYMTFALPLALGYESECEAMDLRITEMVDFEETKARLNAALPRDLQVRAIALQQQKPQAIATADYDVQFTVENPAEFCEALQAFYANKEILVEKKTKKGIKEIDIKPDVQLQSCTIVEDGVCCQMRTAAGQRNINPTLFTDAFLKTYSNPVVVGVFRKRLHNDQGELWK